MSRTSLEDDAPWRVRIRNEDGTVCGGGVLLDPWHVLTCAHVFAAALGRSGQESQTPAGIVVVEGAEGSVRHGSVRAAGWLPVQEDGQGDAAVVELTAALGTRGAPTARLSRPVDASHRAVRVFGYPRNIDHGVWARAQLTGRGGPGGQWVQLDGIAVQGRRVEQGFSGCGVIDDASGRVVGIVVAEDRMESAKVAWMLPFDALDPVWPSGLPLSDLPKAVEGRGRSVSTAVSVTALLAVFVLAVVVGVAVLHGNWNSNRNTSSTSEAPASAAAASGAIQASADWCAASPVCLNLDTLGPWYEPSADDMSGTDRVPAKKAVITITVQSDSGESVLLTGLQVLVRKRNPDPARGVLVYGHCGGCGSGATVRYFQTSLDDAQPAVVPMENGKSPVNDFPYKVSLVDPEYFALVLGDKGCDCTFDLRLNWVAGGKTGHTLLDDHGKHFRMTGTAGIPVSRGKG
ncbi:serine protease [Streptomyces sp. NPDC058440]|uniref:S1 family peptidase n=1 Tax=Streptomyces sp. NPDC058440 TaxID=3346501 RepID=UPI00364C7EBD